MKNDHLLTFVVLHLLIGATASLLSIWKHGWSLGRLFTGGVALVGVGVVVGVGARLLVPRVDVMGNILGLLAHRNTGHLLAAMLGICTALPWLLQVFPTPRQTRWQRWGWFGIIWVALVGTVLATILTAAKPRIKTEMEMRTRGLRAAAFSKVHEPGFTVDLYVQTDRMRPVSVAVTPDERVFVSGIGGYFFQHGLILELVPDPETGEVTSKLVADRLNRPFGIAVRDGDIYVSRSGLWSRYEDGRLLQQATGAVTRLQDLDEDGVMDYYHDVVTGLPGALAPGYFHQNNGLTFAPDGSLYITSGGGGDRSHSTLKWQGTILRASPDFEQVEVFAEGVRNPFALTVTPDGEVFGTDSDSGVGNPGDEINHYIQGAHYGHPYVIDGENLSPVLRDPIYRNSAKHMILTGIAYTESPNLPEQYHGLYVASYHSKEILRVELIPSGDSYRVEVHTFATLSEPPADLAISPAGVLYITCFEAKQVFSIRYTE